MWCFVIQSRNLRLFAIDITTVRTGLILIGSNFKIVALKLNNLYYLQEAMLNGSLKIFMQFII